MTLKINEIIKLVDTKKIEREIDKKICSHILSASRNWTHPIDNLNELIKILEKKINGKTTKKNLINLLERYNKSNEIKKIESISSLIKIFDLIIYDDLRDIFNDLSIRLKPKLPIKNNNGIDKKGFPIILLFDEYFKIKAVDSSKYKKIFFYEIKNVEHINPNSFMWKRIINRMFFWPMSAVFSSTDKWKLIIELKNGKKLNYITSNKRNNEFKRIYMKIKKKVWMN